MKLGKRIILLVLLLILVTTGTVFASNIGEYNDKVALFKDIYVYKNEVSFGNIIAIFGDVVVEGNVEGEIITIFSSAKIDGMVDGNVVAILGSVHMGESSTITGDRVQILSGSYNRPTSSRVMGEDINILIGDLSPELGGLFIILFFVFTIKTIISLIFSILLIILVPEKMDKIADSVTLRLPRKFGIGLLIVLGYYVLTVLGILIIIGLPFIAILVPLMFLLGFTGNTTIKYAIGRKIGKKDGSRVWNLILGSVVYWILDITIILKPILYLAKFVGIGAVIDTKFGTVNYWGEKDDIISKEPAYNAISEKTKEDSHGIDDEENKNDKN